MAAFDAVTTQAGVVTAFNHTPVGTPTVSIFSFHGRGNASYDITGVTYGGEAMAKVKFIASGGGTTSPASNGHEWVETWVKEGPLSGVQAVAITASGSRSGNERMALTTLTGTPTSSSYGTIKTANDNVNDKTVANITGIASATGGLVCDFLATQEAEDHTVDSGQTERFDFSDATDRACGSTEPGAASVDVGWSWTTNTRYAYIAIPFLPVSTGPTAGTDPTLSDAPTEAKVPLAWGDSPDNTGTFVQRNTVQGFTPDPAHRISGDLGGGIRADSTVFKADSSAVTADATGAEETSYIDTTPLSDTQYYYVIEWVDAGGSTFSGELAVKTAPALPTSISFPTIISTALGFQLAMPSASDDNRARVYVFDAGDDLLQIFDLSAVENEAEHTVFGLTANEIYTFKAQSYDPDVNSGLGAYSTFTEETQAAAGGATIADASPLFIELGTITTISVSGGGEPVSAAIEVVGDELKLELGTITVITEEVIVTSQTVNLTGIALKLGIGEVIGTGGNISKGWVRGPKSKKKHPWNKPKKFPDKNHLPGIDFISTVENNPQWLVSDVDQNTILLRTRQQISDDPSVEGKP